MHMYIPISVVILAYGNFFLSNFLLLIFIDNNIKSEQYRIWLPLSPFIKLINTKINVIYNCVITIIVSLFC